MSTYGVIGGSIWGNRGAEAMIVTTIGRVRERDPDATFLLLTYFPERDRALVRDPGVTVVDARPKATVVAWFGAFVARIAGMVGLHLPDAALPSLVRHLRRCRALFDVTGISFHDGRSDRRGLQPHVPLASPAAAGSGDPTLPGDGPVPVAGPTGCRPAS